MYCIASQSLLTMLCRSLVCFSSPHSLHWGNFAFDFCKVFQRQSVYNTCTLLQSNQKKYIQCLEPIYISMSLHTLYTFLCLYTLTHILTLTLYLYFSYDLYNFYTHLTPP